MNGIGFDFSGLGKMVVEVAEEGNAWETRQCPCLYIYNATPLILTFSLREKELRYIVFGLFSGK
ncbi:hypothetical protein GCM10023183_30520 [Nibribacter koreensis]|uniref:Uncharacterized protein n=1 Tax=Nibribacter koreensis TaxID=1084519 RepID=A0ABP8FV73_9BACT